MARNETKRYFAENDVKIPEELLPVVSRLADVIPADVLWELFSSFPSETGGKVLFPYCRVDASLITAKDNIDLLRVPDRNFDKLYKKTSELVFKVLIWITLILM